MYGLDLKMYGFDLKNGYWLSDFFFCNLSQNTCFVYIFWTGLNFQREAFMLWDEEESEQRTWKKIVWRE